VDADAHRVYVSHGAEADVLNAGDSPHWCHNGGSQRCHRVVVIKTALVPLRRLQSDMGRGGASLLLEPNESGPENMQAGMSFRSTVSLRTSRHARASRFHISKLPENSDLRLVVDL
jgi:hypothetical protein